MSHPRFYSLALALIAVAALAGTPGTIAQPPPPPPGVDLSTDQKDRLRSVMDDTKRDLDSLYKRLNSTRQELFKVFDSYDLDEHHARDLIHQMNDIQNKISKRHLQTQKDLRHVVNATQFEQLKRFMGPMRWRHGQGPGSERDRPPFRRPPGSRDSH